MLTPRGQERTFVFCVTWIVFSETNESKTKDPPKAIENPRNIR